MPAVLLQLLLAAIVGYMAGHVGRNEPARVPLTPPSAPAPAVPAPLPPPSPPAATPAPSTPDNAAGAALSVSFRSAVQRAAPSVLTVYSARTAPRGPLGLGGRSLLSEGLDPAC
jgi:hypothetical protein